MKLPNLLMRSTHGATASPRDGMFTRVWRELTFGNCGFIPILILCAGIVGVFLYLRAGGEQKAYNETARNQITVVSTALPLAIQAETDYSVTVNSIIDYLDHLDVIVQDQRINRISTSNLAVDAQLEQKQLEGEDYLRKNGDRWEERIPVEGEKTQDGKPKMLAYIYVFKRPSNDQFPYVLVTVVGSLVLSLVLRVCLKYFCRRRQQAQSDALKKEISLGESQRREFKPALTWNADSTEKPRNFRDEMLKTICGFLNQEGGRLFVGVNDDQSILGIKEELQHFASDRDPEDKLEQRCYSLVRQHLGKDLAYLVKVNFETIPDMDGSDTESEKRVLIIDCQPSPRPVLFKGCLYVRTGNSTQPYYSAISLDSNKQDNKGKEEELRKALLFCIDHFGRRSSLSKLRYGVHQFLNRNPQ
jgi:hypothetical protein